MCLYLMQQKEQRRVFRRSNNVSPVTYIYEKHQIDSLQFAESNEYYAYDIKDYEP